MSVLDGVCPNGPFGTASPEAKAEVERIAAEMSSGGSRAQRAATLLGLAAAAGWPMTAEDANWWALRWWAPVLGAQGELEGISPARSLYLCGCYSWRPAVPAPAADVRARTRWAFNPECPVGHAEREGWTVVRRETVPE